MRLLAIFSTIFLAASLEGATETGAAKLWGELKTKRDQLSQIHQEFDVSRTAKLSKGDQGSTRQIVVDISGGSWREKSVSGSGTRFKIFDGTDLFSFEEGGDEYVRFKRKSKDPDPVPSPYLNEAADWAKSQELQRTPCRLSGMDHTCAVLEVQLKPWSRANEPNNVTTMSRGVAQIKIDTENGLVLSLRVVEALQAGKTAYQSDTVYELTRFSYGGKAQAELFRLTPDLHEVKELSRWNAARIKKQLAGKPAPELTVTDLQGKPVSLASLKGKTVLLDFFTTWCPPCRADAPALDKLHGKYAESLAIVGVSVSEERNVVEKFLKDHPHDFPVVLSTENELPTAYQIGVFPTYIVIDPDGTLASAVEGDQGFGELRKLLKKAGMEVD